MNENLDPTELLNVDPSGLESIGTKLRDYSGGVMDAIADGPGDDIVDSVLDGAGEAISGALEGAGEAIGSLLEGAGGAIGDVLGSLFD